MHTVNVTIEIQAGIATVTGITAPPGLTVTVTIRDYDIEGSETEELDTDENGIPCFESSLENHSPADRPGFL